MTERRILNRSVKSGALCNLLAAGALLCLILLAPAETIGQTPKPESKVISRRVIPLNLPAPELYADLLSMKVTLINLPGANNRTSYWQTEFKVYFVAEREFRDKAMRLSRNGENRQFRPEDFPNRILLTEGKFEKRKLGTLEERAFIAMGIKFKQKIPVERQTARSSILVFYSLKVYDDKLRRNIYNSGVTIHPPCDDDLEDRDRLSPRSWIYLSFYVAENGSVYGSTRKSAGETTKWNPR